MRRLQFVVAHRSISSMQIASQMFALKIIRERDAFFAQRSQLGAALGDDLVVVLWGRGLLVHQFILKFKNTIKIRFDIIAK